MKIQLTASEAAGFAGEHLRERTGFSSLTVSVEQPATPNFKLDELTQKPVVPFREILKEIVDSLKYKPTDKISAIKNMRKAAGDYGWTIGLADSKLAVEMIMDLLNPLL